VAGVEGQIEGFADFLEDVSAFDALVRVFGEFRGYVRFDSFVGDGVFVPFVGDVDPFAEIAEDGAAPWVFRRMGGLGGGGFGGWAWRGFSARLHFIDHHGGDEPVFEGDGIVDGAAEAEEDEAGIGAAGAARRFFGLFGRLGRGFLVGLAEGEVGELEAEHDEALEDIQVGCW